MARRKYKTRTVARPMKPKARPKRWQMFESVTKNKLGQPRLYDRARVTLTGRSARSRLPSDYTYRGSNYNFGGSSGGPWRPKLHPRGANGQFIKK